MELYLHLDRAGGLHPGKRIELEHYRREESRLMLLAPCLAPDFLAALEELLSTGISLHGARYLLANEHSPDISSLLCELVFEYYRLRDHSDQPSRLQSLFAFRGLADLLPFRKDGGRIYRVYTEEKAAKFDMNALKLDFDPQEQAAITARYWQGKPLCSDADYAPCWEYLLTLPVTVLEEIVL